MSDKYEIVTLYRGRDSATYLMSDWVEKGENAEPIKINQYPANKQPYVKMELKDVDAIYMQSTENGASTGKWDVKALKRLLENNPNPKQYKVEGGKK